MELGRTFTSLSRIDCSTCIATLCRYIKTCRLRSETSVQPLCLLTHWLLGLQASHLLCISVLCLLTHWLLGLQLRRVIPPDTQAFRLPHCWSLVPDLTVVTSRTCWLVSIFVLARPDRWEVWRHSHEMQYDTYGLQISVVWHIYVLSLYVQFVCEKQTRLATIGK